MPSTSLGATVRRTSELLRKGATEQILEHESREKPLQALYECFASKHIVSNFSNQRAYETAQNFFGSPSIGFAAVDGTMYVRPLFDLVIFFGGAYASTGSITFTPTSSPTIQYDAKTIEKGAGISSVVPVYVSEVLDIDQTFSSEEQPGEIATNKPLQDSAIISNTTIANWIMSFAEYYLAYRLAINQSKNIQVILLDRSLSNELASLLYDTSKRELWESRCSLIGYRINNITIDRNDLSLGRHRLQNHKLNIPPPRGVYLNSAIFDVIQEKGPIQKSQILQNLKITDNERARGVGRYLSRLMSEKIILEKDHTYVVSEKYATTWSRLKKLVDIIGNHLFNGKGTESTSSSNLLKIKKEGKDYWLTTLDIAFLTLFTFQMLIEECWRRRILLMGITKDTAARDMKRQLIPILHRKGLLNLTLTTEVYKKLPNTDRMILQSISLFNPEKVKIPWALAEYDSAFRTMIPDIQNCGDHVLGAIKNRISLERTFLKTYIQLAQAKKDPLLRSNVLLIDRLAYSDYDDKSEATFQFWNEFGSAREPLEVTIYKNKTIPNQIQNLTMTILHAMTPSSIPEAFGHNKPLFTADKIAKWHYGQFKRIADTTATWILNNHKLRKFVFYMSTFRERRATIEATRRRAAA